MDSFQWRWYFGFAWGSRYIMLTDPKWLIDRTIVIRRLRERQWGYF